MRRDNLDWSLQVRVSRETDFFNTEEKRIHFSVSSQSTFFRRNRLEKLVKTQSSIKRTSLNTKRTCDDEDDEDEDEDDDDDDERYRYDQRLKMFEFKSKTLSSTFKRKNILNY